MGKLIADWKRFHANKSGIAWQDNFFDHRIRAEREFAEKFQYIERNPVAKGLCEAVDDWKWKIISASTLPQF